MERRDEVTVRDRAGTRSRSFLRLVALAPVFLAAVVCSSDVFSVDVDLAPHSFSADFGTPTARRPPPAPAWCGGGRGGAARRGGGGGGGGGPPPGGWGGRSRLT